MNDQDLRARLSATQGAVTISQTTLNSAAVTQLLSTCYADQPIVISDAAPQEGAGVALSGRSTFLGAADLPVTARFELDAGGDVHALLRYQLRDDAPGPTAWTFSRSFPSLPPVQDYATELTPNFRDPASSPFAHQRPFLDALDLFDTWYVVSTHDGVDPVSGIPLAAGINFVSKLRPRGMVGVLEASLSGQPVLTLYGTIRLPQAGDREIALGPLERVWDRPDLAGIHLQAALGVDFRLGGVSLRDARFRIYSPPSQDWMEETSFEPAHGYTGTLSLPSAGIELALVADLAWNLPEALLYGNFEGATLGKLAQLLDLTGTDGLSSHLPQDLQKAVDAVGRLELMQVGLQVAVVGAVPAIQSVSCTVGVPDLRWKVFGEHLVVDDVACRFEVAGAEVSAAVYGTLEIEGVPLNVIASGGDGFTVRAQTGAEVKLPVDQLVKALAPSVQPPSALAVSYLGATVTPGKSYELTTLLAGAPDPWTIPVGKTALTVSDVLLSVSCEQGADATGTFAGTIALTDQVVLRAAYDSPGDFVVRSTFRRINLGELVGKLCDAKSGAPGGFDLTIESATVRIEKRGDSFVFLVTGSVKGFGLVAVEIRKVAGQGWGFATGVDLGGGKLAQLGGLGALKAIEDLVSLDKLMLVLSTFDDAAFTFPDLAKLKRSGVSKGLMAFAEWTLRAGNKQENLLMKLLGAGGTQSAALAVGPDPAKDSRLYVESRGSIQGHPFLYRFGVELAGGVPDLFLDGTLTVNVLGHPQTFDVLGTFTPGGMMIAADMKGSTALDFKVFKLSDVAVQIGVDWVGVPSLGLAGTIDVKQFESSLAVFFDSTDPAKSLVAGSLSPLTMKDVMDTMLGGVVATPLDDVLKTVGIAGTHTFTIPGALAADLDGLVFDQVASAFASSGKVTIPPAAAQLLLVVNVKGASWHLTDLTVMKHYQLVKKGDQIEVSLMPQFYFAPAATRIGTVTYPQGYSLNGALNFAGFKAQASIDIAASKGVSVEAQMDRIVLGNENLFAIEAAQGGGGPKVSISTYAQPNNPVKELQAPHFYVNGKLSMLGVKESVYASLTTKGLVVNVSGPVAPGVQLEVQATLGAQGLNLGGKAKVGVGVIDLGPLGKIKVNTDLDGQLGIVVNAAQIDAWVQASFQFMGKGIQIGRAKLDTSPDALAKLAETMAKKVEAELRNLFADANQWANAMKSGLVDGVQDASKVLRDVYNKSAKEAQDMANDIAGGVTGAANTVAKGTVDAANTVAKGTENVAKDAGKAISSGTKSVGKKLKKLF